MDQFMVDVTDIKDVQINDEVVLIGKQGNKEITVDFIASILDTINLSLIHILSIQLFMLDKAFFRFYVLI